MGNSIFEYRSALTMQGMNQRREQRVPLARSFILSEQEETALLLDLSPNGMAFQGALRLYEEEMLTLHVMLSNGEVIEELPCKVKWAKKVKCDEIKYGVQFDVLTPGQRCQINDVLHK